MKLINLFNGGTIITDENSQIKFESLKELELIINHFDKYPLVTKKFEDYLLFRQAYVMLKNKEHLTEVGLKEIRNIKLYMNKGRVLS